MTWEERWHPLRQEWVVVAAHRQDRPWAGETVSAEVPDIPTYVSDCYLCPGNRRISGLLNPSYSGVYLFDNDHPCVGRNAPDALEAPAGIYRVRPARGTARVLCYSPRHDLALSELELPEIIALLSELQAQYRELGARDDVSHVLVFENRGDVVGVSNPHPHCQIYATNFVFRTIEIETRVSAEHLESAGRILYQDIIVAERQDGRRVIFESDTAIAFLPYFARYAYETHVAPKRTVPSIASLDSTEIADFALALRNVVIRYDNLWRMPFPYVMALHQAPTDGQAHPGFHFHVEFHPPLRKPNLIKYLAGPEIGGGCFLSDTSPEQKAIELIAAGDQHYARRAR